MFRSTPKHDQALLDRHLQATSASSSIHPEASNPSNQAQHTPPSPPAANVPCLAPALPPPPAPSTSVATSTIPPPNTRVTQTASRPRQNKHTTVSFAA